jgi:hypothetical protein
MSANKLSIGGFFSDALLRNPSLAAVFVTIVLSVAGPPIIAQTTETSRVVVSAEPVPTATTYDNWREMPAIDLTSITSWIWNFRPVVSMETIRVG